jgi:hypothetical protein
MHEAELRAVKRNRLQQHFKGTKMKKMIASLLVALGAIAVPAAAVAAVIVQFFPQDTHVAVGDSTQVEMRISGLDDEILSSFDINLRFNPAIVGNTGVMDDFSSHLAPAFFFDTELGPGDVDLVGFSVAGDAALSGQANEFVVLTFTFQGLADGFSFVNLGLDPIFERNFVGLAAQSLAVTVIGACISVGTGECAQVVPEPSTLSLLLLALGGAAFASMGRRPA